MASELEGLIASLLVHISCYGEEGCLVQDVLKAIHHPSAHTEALPKGNSTVQDRTAAIIWSWLVARRDISVGADREYNHLSLDEVLALSSSDGAPGQDAEASGSQPENSTSTSNVRVRASEDTMWESLTGHAVDYKRVPKSEWMLLLGIASTTTQGILQGDLGRLTDQDKRSVPKRTDSLLKKGYIVKRTTLVRGTKTSKMWLKLFAPPLPKDSEGTDEVRPDMTLTRQVLVEDLEPVPWRTRWIGESIDYIALATTIMAIVKEWGVIQMKDMKSKLGVLGMRWQMKVLAKVCRFLNQRGVIQYVAAKLGEKVFKDCVKYVRDLNSEDWSLYLSTGKRKSKTPRNPDLDGLDGNKQLIGQASNVPEISKAPPWSLDKPVPVIIAEMAKQLGDTGLTNPDVYALTLGPSYSRHLSSMTTALSVPELQPPHLAHFQIYSEHTRSGKVASYRYFAPNDLPDPPTMMDTTDQPSVTDSYGFPPVQPTVSSSEASPTLAELCNMGMARRTTKGRPKKPKAKKEKPVPAPKKKAGRKRREETSEIHTQSDVAVEARKPQEVAVPQEIVVSQEAVTPREAAPTQAQEKTAKEPENPPQEIPKHVEATQTENDGTKQQNAALEPEKVDELMVTLKVPPYVLKEPPEAPQAALITPMRPTRTRSTRSSAKKPETEFTETTAENEESQTQESISSEPKEDCSNEQLVSGRKRGRPKKGEVRKKRNEEQPDGIPTPSKSWVCEKCGKAWKNDNGLLYHLTKSRTACNPSFEEPVVTPAQRGRKRAAPEMEVEEQTNATPITDKPQDEEGEEEEEVTAEDNTEPPNEEDNDQETGSDKHMEKKQQDKESSLVREDEPTPKRVSTMRGPVAARPTWSSRPTVSFKVHSNTELRRPPVTMFNSPRQSSLLNGTNGALVQGENSQLRPILGSLNRFNLPGGSQKTHGLKSERNGSQLPTTSYQEQPKSSQPGTNETPSKSGSVAKAKTPTTVGTPLSKAVMNSRISQIVQGILEEQQGVFPGGKSLWTAITLRWTESYSEVAPQIRTYQAAVRELLKNKSAAEHWLTFRSKKGVTEKCHIIVRPEIDPFSPEAEKVVEKIKDAHPDPYLPPPFDAQVDSDLLKRGRRDLPEEVEMLDAPVYVARAAQKRAAQDEYDDDGDDFPPPQKRGRKRKSMFPEGRPSKSRAYQNEMGEPMRYEHFESSQGAPEALQFLDPNTFLDEDDVEGSEHYFSNRFGTAWQQGFSAHPSSEIVFDKPIIVSGYDGIWPYITPQDFEMQGASYTLKGWMPDSNWFAWSSMIDMIDRKAHSLNRQSLQRDGRLSQYQSFVARTYICTDLERAWSDSFIHAPPGAAGPYNIFVSFFSEAGDETIETPTVSWPSVWQLTPKSFSENVPDRALLVDASDEEEDEDDDSSEWPSFPAFLQKPGYRISRARRRGRGGRPRGSGSRLRASARQTPQQPRVKRVRLVTRALMSLPENTDQPPSQIDPAPLIRGEEAERLLAALVAVRVLLGGADKSIDWGLLLKLFPDLSIKDMRRFWVDARRDQGAYTRKLTKDFQDRFIIAYSKNELPEIDFEDPMDYDWYSLIDWTLELPRRRGIDLPATRVALENDFTFQDVTPHDEEDPREKFYNPQTSVFARFEAIATPTVVAVEKMLSGPNVEHIEITENDIARSWVRSLCCTDESRYTVEQIKHKFSTLAGGDQDKINLLLKEAIDALTQQRIICKSKRPPLSGRPFRLNEQFGHVLSKLAQRTKYKDAADFKTQLDATFRRGEAYRIPFTLNDGSVMALINLNASERIRLVPVNVPHIPLGFKPGQYEMRKLEKSLYSHDLEAVPTDLYKYDEEIDVLRKTVFEGPPAAGKDKNSVLPQWVDFFGRREGERWMDVLGAFCFVYANRGLLTIEGVCNALKPVLEEFEAKLIMDWGVKTGVLKYSEEGLGLMVGEWWWLAVPWQWGRQFKHTGYNESMD
ncbi:hypothetical protein FPOAC1_011255 [Fusarium poae]|uniref:hypothetical protein n=1 Tax=Fusarium poae TaxID=36050 RepID=UPI001CEA4E11|nr:hypothetical protein FPOAC1_011255 [Fusarium poae]KAG8666448.1 hypothetical protein FPOAC1_011255 [Fusarium poae]